MNRFELENYRNVLIIDNSILISNTFYQSVEDFKYRKTNSKNDKLKKITEISELEYQSNGNILSLKFEKETLKLVFYSNQRMLDFIKFIINDKLKLINNEKLTLSQSFIPAIFPIIILILILYFSIERFDLIGFFSLTILLSGFIIAIIRIVKGELNSNIVIYKKTTANSRLA